MQINEKANLRINGASPSNGKVGVFWVKLNPVGVDSVQRHVGLISSSRFSLSLLRLFVCLFSFFFFHNSLSSLNRLVGQVVKASASRAEDPGFESRLRQDFSGSSHTSDFNIGTPVAILPGAWRYRVSAGTGRPGVSILWLGEVESWICSFYLSVVAHQIAWADPSLRYTSMLLWR